MSIDKKISLLVKKKKRIDDEIEELKHKNAEILANALTKISDVEKLDIAVILGAVLKATKNINDNEEEVLRNSGKTFLKKFKVLPTNKAGSRKK